MKRLWLLGLVLAAVACSDDKSDPLGAREISGDGTIEGSKGSNGGGAFGASDSASAEAPSSAGSASSSSGGNGGIEAGTLTAGAWDDNRNFDLFQAYRAKLKAAQTPGILPFADAEHEQARTTSSLAAHQTLDISLVIDTTGSMGDEIAYLQKEFDALANTIQTTYPNSQQHWSLVLYRDTTDDYVVRWYDFRDQATEFKTKLATASAGGGGDFPEAPDQALEVAHKLSWRASADTAKLMFWVADAPHHAENAQRLANAIRGASDKKIHIYPVASSGVDELTELTMRSAAQITGGRYLFLTDDSGVGGAHKEPTLPCYFVTKLDRAILRMVDIEMSGTYHEPSADEVLRTGGNPQSGVCTLDSGTSVTIY